jgi:hypothetical protein
MGKRWASSLFQLQKQRRKRQHMTYLFGFHILLYIHKALQETEGFWSMAIQRYHKNGYTLSKHQRKGPTRRRRFVKPPPQSVSLDSFSSANLFSLTGVANKDFMRIYQATYEAIENRGHKHSLSPKKSRTVLTTPTRLAAVFYYLKHYPSRDVLSQSFKVHWKTLWLDRKHILPILGSFLFSNSTIGWSSNPKPVFEWKKAGGSIDCSSHFRNRIHPGHSFYYRGDKHNTFMSVQLVVDLAGSKILSYHIVRGHNNDQGFFLKKKFIPSESFIY